MVIFWDRITHEPPDPQCAALLAISDQEVAIPIPTNCIESSEAPRDAMVKYLDNERIQRGLVFKTWNRQRLQLKFSVMLPVVQLIPAIFLLEVVGRARTPQGFDNLYYATSQLVCAGINAPATIFIGFAGLFDRVDHPQTVAMSPSFAKQTRTIQVVAKY
jgi:hypothetical protein